MKVLPMTPARTLLLCTTPRSGSTLLCSLLRQADSAGQVESWFRAENRALWAADWGLPPDPPFARYLDAAIRAGSSPTGWFGLRMMADNLAELTADLSALFGPAPDPVLLTRAFGPITCLRLTRDDRVAQAVSRYRAEASGLWHRNADGSVYEIIGEAERPVAYSAPAIRHALTEIDTLNRQWDDWFSAHRITPLRLRYEDLAADPQAALDGLLDALGLARQTVRPGTRRLAVDTSARWVARFRAEQERPNAL